MAEGRGGPIAEVDAAGGMARGGLTEPERESRHERVWRVRIPPWVASVAIVVLIAALWQVGATSGWWSRLILPPLSDVVSTARTVIPSSEFGTAVRSTLEEVIASFVAAMIIGAGMGTLFWKAPYIGRICEPYLVSFYAVPFVVIYPVMVVIIGLNRWPIILLATAMGTIPMALNTWIGLTSVREVHWRLAASLQCSRRQTMVRIAIPAAGPTMLAGVRLAAIYALIGSVSMEFLVAPAGLGFEVSRSYETFQVPTMLVYVLVILIIASVIAFAITAVENRVLGKRTGA